MTPEQASKLAGMGSEAIMEIEELELPETTMIELNVSPVGATELWKSLDELSTGQKATAVLLLLLLQSDSPLIIDQIEDDLDNRLITDTVVPRIKQGKRQRQFIFSTHNANIPVLGDAELIVGLTATGDAAKGRASIERRNVGSIDVESVREQIEDVLEGGKAAFEERRLKYGF